MEKKVVKSGIWYVIGDVSVRAVGFITTPIFTRLLTKQEYGNVVNFNAWYAVLAIITSMSMVSTLNRGRYDWGEKMVAYIKSILLLGNCITTGLFLLYLFFSPVFSEIMGLEFKYICILFLCLFFAPALSFFQMMQVISYRYVNNVVVSVIVSVGGVLSALFFVSTWEDKQLALIAGMQLPGLIVGMVLYVSYMFKKGKISVSYWKYVLKICLPYVPHLLSLTLLINTDQIMVKKINGPEKAAIYGVAYSSVLALTVFLNAINNAISPWIGEQLHQKKYLEIKKVSKTYVLIYMIPAILFMFVAPELLYILGGASYCEAKKVLAPLIMATIFQFAYTMYVNIEQYEKKTGKMAIATVTAALVNFFLNAFLIPVFGYEIAAYTTLFSYGLLFVMHMLLVKRMGMLKVYDTGFLLGAMFVALLFVPITLFLYEKDVFVRYGVFMGMIVIGTVIFVRTFLVYKKTTNI